MLIETVTVLKIERGSPLFCFAYSKIWKWFRWKLLFINAFNLNWIFLQLNLKYLIIFDWKGNRKRYGLCKCLWQLIFLNGIMVWVLKFPFSRCGICSKANIYGEQRCFPVIIFSLVSEIINVDETLKMVSQKYQKQL